MTDEPVEPTPSEDSEPSGEWVDRNVAIKRMIDTAIADIAAELARMDDPVQYAEQLARNAEYEAEAGHVIPALDAQIEHTRRGQAVLASVKEFIDAIDYPTWRLPLIGIGAPLEMQIFSACPFARMFGQNEIENTMEILYMAGYLNGKSAAKLDQLAEA